MKKALATTLMIAALGGCNAAVLPPDGVGSSIGTTGSGGVDAIPIGTPSGSGGARGGTSSTGGSSGMLGSGGNAPSSATGGSGSGSSSGATGGSGAADAGTGAGADAQVAASGLPCDVQAVMMNRCTACHAAAPIGGAPMPLVTYRDLTAPAKSDPSRTVAALAVARMQNASAPMPPSGAPPAAEIATVQNWINAGYPQTGCGTSGGGGGTNGGGTDAGAGTGGAPGGSDAGGPPDPFSAPPKCTSGTMWTSGEGQTMRPGESCMNCHQRQGGEAPTFVIAGTLYPSAHEPDDCNGATSSGGAQVTITGADGKSINLSPNNAGNFNTQSAVAKPFTAKVTYMGRTRVMAEAQTSGDCNSCHTQSGANGAPGRILLP